MSYLEILVLLKEGDNAIKENNKWCALALALMLPSYCSRIEYDNTDTQKSEYYRIGKNGNKIWNDKKAYINWCRDNLYQAEDLFGNLKEHESEILYSIRCNFFHAGYTVTSYNNKKIYIILNSEREASICLDEELKIGIEQLCLYIFQSVSLWNTKHYDSKSKDRLYFDKENLNDLAIIDEVQSVN